MNSRKRALLVAWCALLAGCATAQHHSALRVVRRTDPPLAAETTASGFERRLAYLGATIEGAPNPTRTATFLTPASPGYFPPQQVRVVYRVSDDGTVQLQRASVLSLLIVDHACSGERPWNVLPETPTI